jgi:hypothetical protein
MWHFKRSNENDLFLKIVQALKNVMRRFEDVQYVAKIDSDTILFPEMYFELVRSIHIMVGTGQPIYFGTLEGSSGIYMQGHMQSWNALAMGNTLRVMNASLLTPRLSEALSRLGQHNEDVLFGMLGEDAGSFFLGCPRFAWWAQHYMFRDLAPLEYGIPDPITVHKAERLPESMKLDIPERMCDATRGWKCFGNAASNLPKIIWLLWFDGWEKVSNEVILGVQESWKFYNPDWRVILLDRENLSDFVDIPYLWRKDIQVQAKSDIVRLSLLAKHGGVWADASMLCLAPLNDWLPEATRAGGFFAYHQGPNDSASPGPCSWFLVAARNSQIAKMWKNKTDSFWAEPYDPDYELSKGHWENYSYGWMDQQFKHLYKSEPDFREQWAKVPYTSCSTVFGPASFGTHRELSIADLEAGYRNNTPNVIKLTTHGVNDEALMHVRLATELRQGIRISSSMGEIWATEHMVM